MPGYLDRVRQAQPRGVERPQRLHDLGLPVQWPASLSRVCPGPALIPGGPGRGGGDRVSPGPLLTSPGQAPGSGRAGKVLPRPHSAASLPPKPQPEPWAPPPSEAVTRLIH